MAIARHTGDSVYFPHVAPWGVNFAFGTGATGTIDASGEILAHIGHVMWADRGSHDIRSISYLTGTMATGSGTTRRTSLQTVDTTTGPPFRPSGVVDQSFTSTSIPASDTWVTDTLTADRVGVAHGTLLAVCWDYSVFGATTSMQVRGFSIASASIPLRGYPALFTASWAAGTRWTCMLFTAADGTIGWLTGCKPVSSTTLTEAYNNATTSGAGGDERATEFTPLWDIEIDGLYALVQPASGSADFELVLYEGTTPLETCAVDASAISAANQGLIAVPIATPRSLAAGTTYRVAVKPTTANNVTVPVWTLSAAGHRAAHGGTSVSYNVRTDAGAWGTATDTKIFWAGVMISGFDDGAGAGGGGGLLVNPGMGGGMRG